MIAIEIEQEAIAPHGGVLVDRTVKTRDAADELCAGCAKTLRIGGRTAREIISIAYGFFSPLQGFMNREDTESVCRKGELANGIAWPLPIVFDLDGETARSMDLRAGDRLLLEYHNLPLAVLEMEELFTYDHSLMASQIYDLEAVDHPGIKQVHALQDTFLAGPVWLVNPPVFQEPYDAFFFTPSQLRELFTKRGWQRVAAFHTSTVPHQGHEWLMKAAWFQHKAQGLLVSCAVGGKRLGDCIDETVLLCHQALQDAGYFRESGHMVSMILWDRRFAGYKEAVMHAIIRQNMGCTGHIFGKDHATAPGFAESWNEHFALKHMSPLAIESILGKEWFYCPGCEHVTCSSLCGHRQHEAFSSQSVCSLLSSGVKPGRLVLRPEVFDTVVGTADRYGYGDGYVTEDYLQRRRPVFTLHKR